MEDFGFKEMQQIQMQLQERYKDNWGQNSFYGISIEELSSVYREKHQRNMNRW